MSQSVQAAMSQANEYRVPLVVVVADTHADAESIARSRNLFTGNSIVLSVPATAGSDLEFLNQASQSSEKPRIHIFPPAAITATGAMQPAKLVEQTFQHAARMLFSANQLQPAGQEVTAVVGSFAGAAAAWGSVQAKRKPSAPGSGSSPTRQDASPPNATTGATGSSNAAASSSSSAQAASSSSSSSQSRAEDAPPPVSTQKTPTPPTTATASSSSGNPQPMIRIVPRVHIRLHSSAPPGVDLSMAPQPRDKSLTALRTLIAEAAAKSFGNNFHFIQGSGNVRVHHHDESKIMAQDVTTGEFLYVAPDLAAPSAPVKTDAAPTSSSSSAASPAAAAASSSSSAGATAAGGKIRMKITFPDHTDKIETFNSDTTAEEVKANIAEKLGHNKFFMQFPRGRIKDDELPQTLAKLGITRSVAIRIYDIDAMKERAAEYDEKQKGGDEQGAGGGGGIAGAIGGMLSSAGGLLRGRGTTGGAGAGGGADVPPPSSSGASAGHPRSMAEIRRQQDEEEERRKKDSKGNDYYGGSGTNFMSGPPPPPSQ